MDDKDAINKQATSDAQGEREAEPGIAGNVRAKGQDPSPDDRECGEFRRGAGRDGANRATLSH